MDIFTSLLTFAGGIGMFIYGIQVMADGLQKAAGEKSRRIMEFLTNNRFMAVLTGALVTAIIQSSSATTVMVVGFVNAQLMNLTQATGVIMGANIGTTMTSWLVSLSEWGAFLKPEKIAPLLLCVGVFMAMLAKRERKKQTASILIGFGLLFIGLSTMSGAVKPYASSPVFSNAFTYLGGNPLLAILAGMAVTALLQSSSASLGILQTLAAAGLVNWGSAVFIALGQNIGTCINAVISGIGADTNAKRAGIIHLEFNVIGAALAGIVLMIFFAFNPAARFETVSSTHLAIFHTAFNVLTTLVLFPFANWLVKLSKVIIPGKKEDEPKQRLVHLDERLLSSPQMALRTAANEIQAMGTLALENISYSRDVLLGSQKFEQLKSNEEMVDKYFKEISSYLEKLGSSSLSEGQEIELRNSIMALRDLEHISDRCQEIAWIAQEAEYQKPISEEMVEAINTLSRQCEKAVSNALKLQEKANPALMDKVRKYENNVDELERSLRQSWLKSMDSPSGHPAETALFLDAVDCYERIADYARHFVHYAKLEESYSI